MSVEIITFYCRLNVHESDIIRTTESGLNNVFIITSCAVTRKQKRQLRQESENLKSHYPIKKLFYWLCSSNKWKRVWKKWLMP